MKKTIKMARSYHDGYERLVRAYVTLHSVDYYPMIVGGDCWTLSTSALS